MTTSEATPGAPGGNAACGYSSESLPNVTRNGGDASEGKIGLLWEFADEIADASND